jgi:hypothetical protein
MKNIIRLCCLCSLIACIPSKAQTVATNGYNALYESIAKLYAAHTASDKKGLLNLINFVGGSTARRKWFNEQELAQLAQFRSHLMTK